MVAFSTSVLASSRPNAAGEPLHAACVQAVSWTLSAYILPLLQDSTKPPTVIDRYDSGDPNNTDLPRYFPTSTINRYGTSPAQRRDRTIPIPKGYSAVGYVDSLLDNVTLREMLDGVDVGTMVPITMEGYLAQQREAMTRKLRDSSLLAYEMKKPMSSAELTKLIDQATNITIPLPQNAIFGIFGKPEVSINVNGEVNVQAGWRWDTQRLGTASVLGQTQSAPIFNQNIQVNVSGRIGDKFRMNVDWNTLNQFEFNNRFKVG
ncbi:MAG: hypothetical protein KA339_08595, partial [Candidatus Kapabacteria bacterium]|nr:hypothetical protein [Candidatus Kapabacteria bacterium]MBP7093653.1 hypothetical protein [Candidatus Kapabacteria bacterium]